MAQHPDKKTRSEKVNPRSEKVNPITVTDINTGKKSEIILRSENYRSADKIISVEEGIEKVREILKCPECGGEMVENKATIKFNLNPPIKLPTIKEVCKHEAITQQTFDYPMVTVEYCDRCGEVLRCFWADKIFEDEKLVRAEYKKRDDKLWKNHKKTSCDCEFCKRARSDERRQIFEGRKIGIDEEWEKLIREDANKKLVERIEKTIDTFRCSECAKCSDGTWGCSDCDKHNKEYVQILKKQEMKTE